MKELQASLLHKIKLFQNCFKLLLLKHHKIWKHLVWQKFLYMIAIWVRFMLSWVQASLLQGIVNVQDLILQVGVKSNASKYCHFHLSESPIAC